MTTKRIACRIDEPCIAEFRVAGQCPALTLGIDLRIYREVDEGFVSDRYGIDMYEQERQTWLEVESHSLVDVPRFMPGVIRFQPPNEQGHWITRPIVNVSQVKKAWSNHTFLRFTSSYEQIVKAMLDANAIWFDPAQARIGEFSRPVYPDWWQGFFEQDRRCLHYFTPAEVVEDLPCPVYLESPK